MNCDQSEDEYWKGKLTMANRKGPTDSDARMLEIGYFPCDCVRLIDDKRLLGHLSPSNKGPYDLHKELWHRFAYIQQQQSSSYNHTHFSNQYSWLKNIGDFAIVRNTTTFGIPYNLRILRESFGGFVLHLKKP
ncbi:hypothetical protein COOONC_27550 [Cooperia oncophora]